MLLTLFSAVNEASFEGALLYSLNIFQQMRISSGKSLQTRTNSLRVAQWMLQAKIFSYLGCVGKCVHMTDEITPCLRVLHRGTKAQRGWWLRVKGQMLDSDRDVVAVR